MCNSFNWVPSVTGGSMGMCTISPLTSPQLLAQAELDIVLSIDAAFYEKACVEREHSHSPRACPKVAAVSPVRRAVPW